MRAVKLVIAALLLVIGIISLPLPFPTGIPLMVVALTLVLGNSHSAKVKHTRFKRRLNPGTALYKWIYRFDFALRRKRLTHTYSFFILTRFDNSSAVSTRSEYRSTRYSDCPWREE